MSAYLKALVVSLILGSVCFWAFYEWRERSFKTTAVETMSFMDQLEKNGLPEMSYTAIDGKKFESKDHKGKIILVNFWASWCAPCLEEVPSMLKLVKEMKGKMVLVAPSQDSQVGEIEAFIKAFPEVKDPNVYIVWDKDRSIAKTYKVDRLPESYLSNGSGKLAKKIIGSIQWFSPESISYLEQLLKE